MRHLGLQEFCLHPHPTPALPCPALQVTELPPLLFLPPFLLRRKVLRPMATMAGGTMMAAALAMEHGWAINLGGGMHHAAPDAGGGWCPYADLALAMRRLHNASGGAVSKFMVVDLDVHQVRPGVCMLLLCACRHGPQAESMKRACMYAVQPADWPALLRRATLHHTPPPCLLLTTAGQRRGAVQAAVCGGGERGGSVHCGCVQCGAVPLGQASHAGGQQGGAQHAQGMLGGWSWWHASSMRGESAALSF